MSCTSFRKFFITAPPWLLELIVDTVIIGFVVVVVLIVVLLWFVVLLSTVPCVVTFTADPWDMIWSVALILEVLAINPVIDFDPVMMVLMLPALVFFLLLVVLADDNVVVVLTLEFNLKINEVNSKYFLIYLQIYFSIQRQIFGLKNLVKTSFKILYRSVKYFLSTTLKAKK